MKIIIIGAGEVGYHIAGRLALENKDVVVVDRNMDSVRRVADHLDVQTIHGSGSSPVILEQAGIREAEILLAVTDSDEANLVACLMANILSPGTKKLARIRGAEYDAYHDQFRDKPPHIDTIINPEIEVVKTIDRLLRLPGAVDAGEFENGKIIFVGVRLDETARLINYRLSEISMMADVDRLLIVAIVRDEELIIPRGDDHLQPNDLVYFISEESRLMENLIAFEKHVEPLKRVLIVGGGRIGLRLARLLEERSISTRIIERDPERCTVLAESLSRAVVLCGDGSDQDLLSEENIHNMDAVVTLTNDEETNVLVSLLGRRMGARKAITKISRFNYFPLMASIGVEQIVSSRLSAINTILQHIRRGKVLSAMSLKGEQAEVLEAEALETSAIVGKPLKQINFPKGAILAAIIRGEQVIIPSGDSVVEPHDRVIIFAKQEAISKIEKILMVKLEFF